MSAVAIHDGDRDQGLAGRTCVPRQPAFVTLVPPLLCRPSDLVRAAWDSELTARSPRSSGIISAGSVPLYSVVELAHSQVT